MVHDKHPNEKRHLAQGIAGVTSVTCLLLPSPAPANIEAVQVSDRLAQAQEHIAAGNPLPGYAYPNIGRKDLRQAQFQNYQQPWQDWNDGPFNNRPFYNY